MSILEHAVTDVVERLRELPATSDTEELRALARQYEMEIELWREHPPDREKREQLLRSVLDLSVEVIRVSGGSARRSQYYEEEDESEAGWRPVTPPVEPAKPPAANAPVTPPAKPNKPR